MVNSIIFTTLQDVLYILLLVLGAFFFGRAFYKIYKGEPVFFKKASVKLENSLYKIMGVDKNKEMSAKEYIIHILLFTLFSLILFIAVVMLQEFLIFNPNNIKGMSWDLAFNTAASFITNTNWQSYSGEASLSYLSQMLVLTSQNFLSGAVGIAVLFALLRGFTRKETKNLGNFYVDLTKITLFMIPVCFVTSLIYIAEGIPQTFIGNISYQSLEGTKQTLFLGPVASQIAIKQFFSNGGGYYGTNSAYPYENPTPLTNLIQMLSILWIPASMCFVFSMATKRYTSDGVLIKERSQGSTLLVTMMILFVLCLVVSTTFEYLGGIHNPDVLSYGNMEGKEVRFGVGQSVLWSVATTCASNGSVNCMHDSLTPISGMIAMFLMMLGEIVFGGVGCGLYGMIGFAILTVFIAGLMVGRTPEYIGKKIGSYDMKMVCLIILTPVLCILLGTASTVLLKEAPERLTNSGAHGFSEILYAFTSLSANNGSAFAGFNGNTVWTNVIGGIILLAVRFIPMTAVILLSGSLAKKKIIPTTEGTLATNNSLFVGLLIGVIIIIGALSFLPSLALGPIADYIG